MSRNISIKIENLNAIISGDPIIVCNNSDYVITFAFDEGWDAYDVKTARFVYTSGGHIRAQDVVFTGNVCPVPVFYGISDVLVGVFAGDLHTTTPAKIYCRKSILDYDGPPEEPDPDVYAQIMELIKSGQLQGPAGDSGATYTPAVSDDGELSWTNDRGLDNPEPVNIRGPQGDNTAALEAAQVAIDAAANANAAADAALALEPEVEQLKNDLINESEWVRNGLKVVNFSDFEWEQGSINNTTGEDRPAGEATKIFMRTKGYIDFDGATIKIDDTAKPENFKLMIFSYNKSDLAFVKQVSSSVSAFPWNFATDNQYVYRFLYYDTTSAVPTDISTLFYTQTYELNYVPAKVYISLMSQVDTKVSKEQIESEKRVFPDWQIGSINGTGELTPNAKMIRTEAILRLVNPIIAITTTHTFKAVIFKYDETGTYESQKSYTDTREIELESGYYRIVYLYTDDTSAVTDNISMGYEVVITNRYNVDDTFSNIQKIEIARGKESNHAIRKPMVTLMDDDGHSYVKSVLVPIMEQYNVPIALAIMATYPNYPDGGHLTFTEIHNLQDIYGCEVVGHTATPLIDMTEEQFTVELESVKRILTEQGFDVRGYAYPYGLSTEKIREVTSKHYDFAFKTKDDNGVVLSNYGCVPNYYINRISARQNNNSVTLDELKSAVDDCIARNGWLVILSHAYYMDETSIKIYKDMLDYINEKGVDIVSPSVAFDVFGNALQSGDYLGYWNTDGCAISKDGQWDFPISKMISH